MGVLRLFLALSVVAAHAETTVFGFNGINSWYAVNFFFIISGFYMAMILNEKYKDMTPIHFYKSRAFRLFPVYYIGIFISLLVSFGDIKSVFDHLPTGAQIFFIFQNLFIFGQDLSFLLCIKKDTSLACASPMQINIPAWSLAVELGFYLVAPFILKNVKKTYLFVLFGCWYLISLNQIDFPLGPIDFFNPLSGISAFNYFFYPSSFIFFGGGALAYHLRKGNLQDHYFATLFVIILLSFTQTQMPFWHLLFICFAIPLLFNYTATNRIDRDIGELSYPAYILHYPILLFLKPFTQTHSQYFDFISLGSWVAIISCIIGFLLYRYVEKSINNYRQSEQFFDTKTASESNIVIRTFITSLLFMYFCLPIAAITYIYSYQYSTAHNPATTPFNLTDANWINGVGKTASNFFIANTSINLAHYQVGKFLRFSNGDIRKIVQVEQSGQFLTISVDGLPLNGQQIGFPNKIEIIK